MVQNLKKVVVWVAIGFLVLTAWTVDELTGTAELAGEGVARVFEAVSTAVD